MSAPQGALSGLPGGDVHVAGFHTTLVGGGAGLGGAHGAGFLAFSGVGPGTLPLALAGVASIVAGAAATIWGRGEPTERRRRRAHRNHAALPDLSHLAEAV